MAGGAPELRLWADGHWWSGQETSQTCSPGTRVGSTGWGHSIRLTASEKKIPMQLASLFAVPMYLDKFEHIANILCHGMEWILNAAIGSLCNILNTC